MGKPGSAVVLVRVVELQLDHRRPSIVQKRGRYLRRAGVQPVNTFADLDRLLACDDLHAMRGGGPGNGEFVRQNLAALAPLAIEHEEFLPGRWLHLPAPQDVFSASQSALSAHIEMPE